MQQLIFSVCVCVKTAESAK